MAVWCLTTDKPEVRLRAKWEPSDGNKGCVFMLMREPGCPGNRVPGIPKGEPALVINNPEVGHSVFCCQACAYRLFSMLPPGTGYSEEPTKEKPPCESTRPSDSTPPTA